MRVGAGGGRRNDEGSENSRLHSILDVVQRQGRSINYSKSYAHSDEYAAISSSASPKARTKREN